MCPCFHSEPPSEPHSLQSLPKACLPGLCLSQKEGLHLGKCVVGEHSACLHWELLPEEKFQVAKKPFGGC